MNTLSALIIDDEEQARYALQTFLKEYCPDVAILGEETNVPDEIKAINRCKPDLVFLDIEMPGISGFKFWIFLILKKLVFKLFL